MRQTKTFPLLRASQVNSLHPTEIQLPGLVSAKNVYISPSDNAVTLRHDLYTFREDIPTLVDHWTGSTSEDKSDFLNMLLTGPNATDQQFITRLFPMGLEGVCLSSTYIDGTITTTGSSSTVTGSGTTWVKNVWPGSFIQFAGSSNIYLIKLVESDTSLTVDGTPPALSGVTYKVYRTHDYNRGLYPGHFDQLANNYVYNMATPFDNESEDINSICGPFTMVKPIARVPEIQTISQVVSATGEISDNTIPLKFVSVARGASAYLAVGATKEIGGKWVYRFYSSTDGSTWSYSSEVEGQLYGDFTADIGDRSTSSSQTPMYSSADWTSLRYFSADAFYFTVIYSNLERRVLCVYKSADGASWTRVSIGDKSIGAAGSTGLTGTFSDIASNGAGTYVVVTTGSIWTATDPTSSSTYTKRKDGGQGWYSVAWNSTNFAIVGNSQIWYGSDGITWTRTASSINGNVQYRVNVGATNHFIAAGGYSNYVGGQWELRKVILRSTDNGSTWATVLSVNEIGPFRDVIWDGTLGLYIAVGYTYTTVSGTTTYYAVIYTSPDGTTWTKRNAPDGTRGLTCCSSAGTHAVALGSNATIIRSTNGTSWSALESITQNPDIIDSLQYGGTFLICGEGGSFAFSSDGSSWTFSRTGVSSTYSLNGITATDIDWIVVGDTGTIVTTPDFATFTSRTSGVTVHLNAVSWDSVYGTSRVVVAVGNATGGAGIVLSTSDFATWTSRTSNTTKSLNDVCHDGSALFVAVGEDGAIITSANGIAWTARTSGTSEDLKAVSYSKPYDLFCAVGTAGMIVTSSDGITWSSPTSATSTQLNDVIWTGTKFVAVGENGTGIESADGVTWSSVDTDTSGDLNTICSADDYQIAFADSGIAVKLYNSTLSSQWLPVSDTYRASGFAVASGFLVLVGTSEFENGRWVYYPRRVRWAVPGTVDTWEGEGAGGSDLPGTGAVLDCRTLGYNIILFESSQISALNSTEDIYSPFSYQVIHAQMRCISNPLVIDQQCFFVTPDGNLYKTNGFNVTEVCQPFDLTKYKDFDDSGPIWLTYDREMRRILCYRPRKTDSEHIMYIIDPDGATVTSAKLEDVTAAGGGYYQGASGINFARSLPAIPTDYKFISTLELTDLDGDGEAETPVRVPFPFRWITGNGDAKGTTFADICYNTTASTFLITEDENIYSVAASSVLEWPEYSHFDGAPIITIVNYADASVSGCDVEIIYNGTTYNGVEGVDWTAAVGNNDTAASLDSWLTGTLGLTTSRVNNVITISDACQGGTSADATGVLVTHTAVDTVGSGTLTRRATGYSGLAACGWDGTNYVVTSNATYILYSPDLTTWTAATIANRTASDQITAVVDSTTAPFLLALSSEYGTSVHYILKSVDNGVNWTDEGDTPFVGEVLGIQYLNGKFWIVGWDGADGYTAESSDGSTWVTGTLSGSSSFRIFYMNSTYYSAGGNYTNDDWFYSPAADISGGTRNWYQLGVDSVAALGCEQITIGSEDFMVAGTYQDAAGDYVGYCYWSDNGSRFMPIPKPTPESTVIEAFGAIWNGSYLLFLGSDHT